MTHEGGFLENHEIRKQKRIMNKTIQKASLAIIFLQDTPDTSCQDRYGFTTSNSQGLQDTVQDDQDHIFK